MKTLDEMLQPDQKVRVFYNEGNINNQLRHIRAIVDDEFVVFRVWSKHKQYWVYKVEHRYNFELKYEGGHLS